MNRFERTAIFDLDGTLYKTECVSLRAVHGAIHDLGLDDKDDERIKSLFGYTTPDLCKILFPELDDQTQSSLSQKVRGYERSLIGAFGELYEGVRELLERLRAGGWGLTLCTNGSQAYVDTVLDGMKVRDHFDAVRLRDGVRTKTDHVREIVAGGGCCVMIGDKRGDIDAARANGIPSVGASWGYGTAEEIAPATFRAARAADVEGVLARCNVYHEVMRSLQSRGIAARTPATVGINGVDTAGKTCFARELAAFLQAHGYRPLCVHLDDFHNPAEKRHASAGAVDAYFNNAFDLGLLCGAVLAPFRDRRMLDTELTLVDIETDQRTVVRKFVADAETVLIVEGTLLFRRPVDEYLDYRIYLDIPFDEVVRRAQVRDVPRFGAEVLKKYSIKYIPAQQQYLESVRPAVIADMVIDNSDIQRPAVTNNAPPPSS